MQGGFMPGTDRKNQMVALQQVIEKYSGVNKKVYAAFIDLEISWGVF